jgi:hypothetical protein
MLDCKPSTTSIVENHHLQVYPDQIPPIKDQYLRLVGKLIHLSRIRPNIAYVVGLVSQFAHSLNEEHKEAIK